MSDKKKTFPHEKNEGYRSSLNLVPGFIAENLSRNRIKGRISAFTMFIDISGFTAMTQDLMKHGKEGAEVLSSIINGFFAPSIEAVYENGGFISSFAGDAFTAIFRVRKAEHVLNAAFSINSLFRKKTKTITRFGKFRLSAKIGLSSGNVFFRIIDAGIQKAYFFRGEAVDNCASAEHQAKEMQIIADSLFMAKLSASIDKSSIGDHWYRLSPASLRIPGRRKIKRIAVPRQAESQFIPEPVFELRDRGEFRDIVSCFINFKEKGCYLKALAQVIRNCRIFGGYFNRIDFGDKGGTILVLFGAPKAMDRLYQRAADFALSLRKIRGFAFRAGLSSGIAFAGFIGSDIRQEYTAFGNVVNLSSRIMMDTSWMGISADRSFAAELPAYFDAEPEGSRLFKGFKQKTDVFSLRSKQAFGTAGFFKGKFIGRQDETAELAKFLKPVFKGSQAGLIYITGPAGIGKTALIENFTDNIRGCNVFYLPCDEILKKPFNPFIHFFRAFFNQSESYSENQNRDRFERAFDEFLENKFRDDTNDSIEDCRPLIGAMIGLDYSDQISLRLDAKGRYDNTVFAVIRFFKTAASIKPILIVLEDAQWADNDSLFLLRSLLISAENYPVAVTAVCRDNDGVNIPDIHRSLPIRTERIRLGVFSREHIRQLLLKKLVTEKADDSTVEFVWKKSEGIPFFAEQIIMYLAENKLLGSNYRLKRENTRIPSKVSQIILARIDRLSAELKETIKTASVLGREFGLKVLERLLSAVKLNESEMDFSEKIKKGQKEHIWSKASELRCIFRHALIRDAVYEIQLKERLRRLHGLAGSIIEEVRAGNLPEHYEELAQHYDKAENRQKAVIFLELAGRKSAGNYHNEKAVFFYKKLLDYLNDDIDKRIDILIRTGIIMQSAGMWNEAVRTLKKALSLSEKNRKTKTSVDCMNAIAETMIKKGRIREARKLLGRSLKIADDSGYLNGLGTAFSNIGYAHNLQGNYTKAIIYHSKNLEICKMTDNKKGSAISYENIGTAYLHQCNYKEAQKYYERSLNIYRSIDDYTGIGRATGNLGAVFINLGDYSRAKDYQLKKLKIATETGNRAELNSVYNNLGNICYYRGEYDNAMEWYKKHLDCSRALGDMGMMSIAYGLIANIYSDQGNYKKAFAFQKRKLDIAVKIGDKNSISYACGNIGVLCFNQGNYRKAMEYYNKKMKICQEIGDKSGISYALGNIGVIYFNRGNYKKAMEFYTKKMKICSEIGDKRGIAGALGNIGVLFYKRNDFGKAIDFYKRQLEICNENGYKYESLYAYHNTGSAFLAQGDPDNAMLNFIKHMEISKEIKHTDQIGRAHDNFGLIHMEKGNYKQALKHFEKAAGIAGDIGFKYNLCSYLLHISELLHLMGRKQDIPDRLDEAILIAREIERYDVLFSALVLKHSIDGNIKALIRMLQENSSDQAKTAVIYYELWKITNKAEYRDKAEELNMDQFKETSRYEFKKRLKELSMDK